eukprot:gene6739-9468_t
MATVGDDQIISSETVTVEANAKKQPRECDARDEEQENDEDIHKLLLNEAHAILSRAPAVADGEAASQLILYQPPPGWGLWSTSTISIAIQGFCMFHQIPLQVINTNNTAMSSKDQLPILRIGKEVVLDTPHAIFHHLEKINDARLVHTETASVFQQHDKGDVNAFMTNIMYLNTISNLLVWMDGENRKTVGHILIGSYPWPLQKILTWRAWLTANKHWKSLHPYDTAFNIELLVREADDIYRALNARLANLPLHVVGSRFTFVDAMLYAHISWIEHAPFPNNPLKSLLGRYQKLTDYHQHLARILD